MAISPINGPTRRQDDDTSNESTPQARAAVKEFDFSGCAYAAINLPTGAFAHASATPSVATVKADLDDLERKVVAFHVALASPQMREAIAKNGAALYTLTKMEAKLAAIVATIAVLKQFGVASVGGLRVAKDVAGGFAALVAIPEDLAKFISQFKQAIPTIGPGVAPVILSAAEVTKSALKLASDAQLVGVR
jgi:hypothetical protein